jgi:hypothetical protein
MGGSGVPVRDGHRLAHCAGRKAHQPSLADIVCHKEGKCRKGAQALVASHSVLLARSRLPKGGFTVLLEMGSDTECVPTGGGGPVLPAPPPPPPGHRAGGRGRADTHLTQAGPQERTVPSHG